METPSIHRLQLGLPGYLSLFAPLAFGDQRQLRTREPPSPLVFLPISAHSTATLEVPFSSSELKMNSIKRRLKVKPLVFTFNLFIRLHPLYTQ